MAIIGDGYPDGTLPTLNSRMVEKQIEDARERGWKQAMESVSASLDRVFENGGMTKKLYARLKEQIIC